MQHVKKVMAVLTIFSILPFTTNQAFAQSSALEQRLNDLEQQVAVLKRQIEIDKEEAAKKAPDTAVVTANSKDGFSIKSPDDSFKIKIRGVIQADSRVFTTTNKEAYGPGTAAPTTDSFLVRRARPILEGSVGKNFDFYLMPDFAQTPNNNQAVLVDAYGDFKINPAFKIRGGKFKAPLGLERLQSDPVANFMETGFPTNLVPNRDVGFQVSGDVLGESVNYALGVFNGGSDLASVDTSDVNNDKDAIGRVFVTPFKNTSIEPLKGFGIGIGGSYGHKEGGTLPTYRSPGQANVFAYSTGVSPDGAHSRLSPQAYYYNGSFGLLGEYVQSEQKLVRTSGATIIRDSFKNTAWQVSGNYLLTGELASYKGITPRRPFDLSKGQWGAFELVGRYGELDVDDDVFNNSFASLNSSITNESAWGTGLNWYPTKNVRVSVNFEKTQFKGGATNVNRPDEKVLSSRLQFTF